LLVVTLQLISWWLRQQLGMVVLNATAPSAEGSKRERKRLLARVGRTPGLD
jgi:hypothetical protein